MRFMKKTKVKVIGGLLTTFAIGATGCTNSALGLQDYQRDLLFGFGGLAIALLTPAQAGPQGEQGEQGPAGPAGADAEAGQGAPGEPGEAGLSCWDINSNFIADADEDINGDGVWDAQDCQGAAGSDGADGATGPAGADGADGAAGAAGDPYFDLFIDDFFTMSSNYPTMGGLPDVEAFEEPIIKLHSGMYDDLGERNYAPTVGFRAAVPTTYTEGNLVTLRLFLYRTAVEESSDCGYIQLGTYRLINGQSVEALTSGGADSGERLIKLTGGHDEMIVIDLPLNAASGLNFATAAGDGLASGQFLAFEFTALLTDNDPMLDGAEYLFMGAELFESGDADAAATTTVETLGSFNPSTACGSQG